MTVNNSATVAAAGSGNDMNIYYFKLLSTGAVTITGGSYTLYDMNAEQTLTFTSGSSLNTGYYKLVNTGSTSLTLTYSNSYTNISYYFFNEIGQMVASIAPAGVKSLFTNGLGAYANKAAVPYITLKTYDQRGRLLKNQDPDRGIQQFVYRNDGKIRFAQNAAQATTGSFSYTNYDQAGRIVETGQYTPPTPIGSGIAFNSTAMTGILETTGLWGGLTSGTMTDVVINDSSMLRILAMGWPAMSRMPSTWPER